MDPAVVIMKALRTCERKHKYDLALSLAFTNGEKHMDFIISVNTDDDQSNAKLGHHPQFMTYLDGQWCSRIGSTSRAMPFIVEGSPVSPDYDSFPRLLGWAHSDEFEKEALPGLVQGEAGWKLTRVNYTFDWDTSQDGEELWAAT